MEHKLRVLIRLDVDQNSAVLAASGCLTAANYQTLVPIIRRTQSLVSGPVVVVDLMEAQHIEASAVDLLFAALPQSVEDAGAGVNVSLRLPEQLPACPVMNGDGLSGLAA